MKKLAARKYLPSADFRVTSIGTQSVPAAVRPRETF
jgi:hypothetical protein